MTRQQFAGIHLHSNRKIIINYLVRKNILHEPPRGACSNNVVYDALLKSKSIPQQMELKSLKKRHIILFFLDFVEKVIRPSLPKVFFDKSAICPPDLPINKHHSRSPIKQKERLKVKRNNFLESDEWYKVRYQALKKYGRRCMCCGATPDDGAKIHVDHIKPRSKYPMLELELSNLQILCKPCNFGKSNIDNTDFRQTPIIHDICEVKPKVRLIKQEQKWLHALPWNI